MAKKTPAPPSSAAPAAGAAKGQTPGRSPAPAKMSDEQVAAAMAGRPDWVETGGAIQRTFQFKSFVEAMKFVNGVAQAAEAANHHPDILVRYNKVTMTLSTHDAGGITAKDFELAAKMDAMV